MRLVSDARYPGGGYSLSGYRLASGLLFFDLSVGFPILGA
jgi:hypothetical protein